MYRRISLLILLLFGFGVGNAQNVQPFPPNTYVKFLGGAGADSILNVPVRDTVDWLGMTGSVTIRPQDGRIYYNNGAKWVPALVSGDTVWLHEAITDHIAADQDLSPTNELQNLSLGPTNPNYREINISGGSGVTLHGATPSVAGLMTGTDKSKLNWIEPMAEVNVQSDFDENDPSSDAYILNKPTIPDASTLQKYADTNTVDATRYWVGQQGFISTETDPTVPAHVKAISNANITNWDQAFTWGDHAAAGYEIASNKRTSLASPNNTTYPTTQAVQNAINSVPTHDPVTLDGEDYLSISGQVITAEPIDLSGSNTTGSLPAASVSGLADVATSGDYNDLSNTPTIPGTPNLNEVTSVGNNSGQPITITGGPGPTVGPIDTLMLQRYSNQGRISVSTDVAIGMSGSSNFISLESGGTNLSVRGYNNTIVANRPITASAATIPEHLVRLSQLTGAITNMVERGDTVALIGTKYDIDTLSDRVNTKEDVANKRTTLTSPNNITYPSTQAVVNYVTDIADDYIPLSEKGVANGVATLGANGKLPNSQVPAIAITETFVVNSQAAMLALSAAEQGDVAVRTDLSKSMILVQAPPSTLANWQELLTPTGESTNLSLGAATGTSRAINNSNGTGVTLPAATAALAGLMSGADKTKLDGVQAGAEVNVNPDWDATSGDAFIENKPSSMPPSGSAGGDLTGTYPNPSIANGAVTNAKINDVAWSKVTGAPSFLTTETDPTVPAHVKSITTGNISQWNAAEQNVQSDWDAVSGDAFILNKPAIPLQLNPTAGTGMSITGTYPNLTFTNTAPNVPSNLAVGTRTNTTVPITNSNGNGVTIPAATTTLAGVMTGTEKAKLNGIQAGAQVNDPPQDLQSVTDEGNVTDNAIRVTNYNGFDPTGPNADGLTMGFYDVGSISLSYLWHDGKPILIGSNSLGGSSDGELRILHPHHNVALSLKDTRAEFNTTVSGQPAAAADEFVVRGQIDTIIPDVSGFVPSARTITAGNGLTGGGSLAADRTVTLGTPGSISAGSTNSVTATSHTHELAANAVTTAKIANGAVTNAKINDVAWSKVTGAPSFLTSESDPTVPAHVKSITTTEKSNWNTAFGWGNHASAGYEVLSNKATSLASPDNIKYPTTKAVSDAIAAIPSHNPVTLAGQNYLSLSGQQITAGAINLNSSHTTGTLPVNKGGSGATTLTGYLKGNGTSAFTAVSAIPYADISGTPAIPAQLNPTAGTGMSITGTYPNLTFTNTAPNQASNLALGTANATTRAITNSNGTGITLPSATTTIAGLMPAADKVKLNGIAAGAQVNVPTNLGSSLSGSNLTITSSTGSNTSVNLGSLTPDISLKWDEDFVRSKNVSTADANTSLPTGGAIASYSSSNWLTNGPTGFTYGGLLDISGLSGRQSLQLAWSSGHAGEADSRLAYRTEYGTSGGSYRSWREIPSMSDLDNYMTTNTSQTGLTGDKTTSGSWWFRWRNGNWYVDNDGNERLYIGPSTSGHAHIFRASGSSQFFRFRNSANTDVFTISGSTGQINSANLAGTGTRMVTVNAAGTLLSQAIPSGTNLSTGLPGEVVSSTGTNARLYTLYNAALGSTDGAFDTKDRGLHSFVTSTTNTGFPTSAFGGGLTFVRNPGNNTGRFDLYNFNGSSDLWFSAGASAWDKIAGKDWADGKFQTTIPTSNFTNANTPNGFKLLLGTDGLNTNNSHGLWIPHGGSSTSYGSEIWFRNGDFGYRSLENNVWTPWRVVADRDWVNAQIPSYGASVSIGLTGGNFFRQALTGDVTAPANSNATTIANNAVTTAKIANNAVTYAKMQDINTQSIIGREAAGSGDPEQIKVGEGLEIASGELRLTGSGAWTDELGYDYEGNADNNAKGLDTRGGYASRTQVLGSGSYTLATDVEHVVFLNHSGSNSIITLPNPASFPDRVVTFCNYIASHSLVFSGSYLPVLGVSLFITELAGAPQVGIGNPDIPWSITVKSINNVWVVINKSY